MFGSSNMIYNAIKSLEKQICCLRNEIAGEATPANPTASVGLTAINGVSTSYMRADAAPAINQAITPVWTGIHTFAANPILKSVVPSLQYQLPDNTQLGFINMGDGAANVPAFISPLVSDQLRITVGTAVNATFTFANAGQFGIGNPVNFGTLGQVLTSGGPTGVISWSTPVTATGANPTATVGATAVNGVATTFMRSDAAPAIDLTMSPTWTGTHIFNGPTTNTVSSLMVGGPVVPAIEIFFATAPADQKRWRQRLTNTTYSIDVLTDTGAAATTAYQITRAAAAVTAHTFLTGGTAKLAIANSGTITASSLAGTGNRAVMTTASGALFASQGPLTGGAAIVVGEIPAGGMVSNTISVPGAAAGDPVFLGMTPSAGATADFIFQAYVSAADTVAIRINNIGAAPINPGEISFKVVVSKF